MKKSSEFYAPFFSVFPTGTIKGEKVDWYVTPNAVFTFVARLGADKAGLSGCKGERVITAGASRDVLVENFSSSKHSGPQSPDCRTNRTADTQHGTGYDYPEQIGNV